MYHHPSRAAKTGRVVARDVREFTGFCSVSGMRLSAGFYIHFLICTGCKLWFTVQLTSSGDSGDRKTAWKTGNKKVKNLMCPNAKDDDNNTESDFIFDSLV